MSDSWAKALERAIQGHASVLVTIYSVEGSAPREPCTKMLVWEDGQAGTVGGGNLEFVIAQQARKMLAGGDDHRLQSYPLGPLLGQCCGGRVDVLMERIVGESIDWLREVARLDELGRTFLVQSRFESGAMRRTVLDLQGVGGTGPDGPFVGITDLVGRAVAPAQVRSAKTDFIISEYVLTRPMLLMFGAGHVGRALARIVAPLPLRTRWYDTRLEFGVVEGPLQPIIVDDLVARIDAAPSTSLFLIFTQSHDLDYALTHAALKRFDYLYCGLIGSATKRARFEKRLLADGIPAEYLPRLTCPIGAIGLKSKAPEVLAVAIAAEIMLNAEARMAYRTPKRLHAR